MNSLVAFGDLVQALLHSAAKRANRESVKLGSPGGYVWCLDSKAVTPARCSLDAIVQLDPVPGHLAIKDMASVRVVLDSAISVHTRDGQYDIDIQVEKAAIRLANSIGIPYLDVGDIRRASTAASPWPKYLQTIRR